MPVNGTTGRHAREGSPGCAYVGPRLPSSGPGRRVGSSAADVDGARAGERGASGARRAERGGGRTIGIEVNSLRCATGTGGRTLSGMDRLRPTPTELLDGPLDDPAALAGNLRDLRRVNRWLGGVGLSAGRDRGAGRPSATSSTLLDVGTGGADIPVALLERAAARGRRLVGRRPRQPAGGPRRGRPGPPGPGGDRRPRAARRRRPVAPLPRPLVRRRPLLAGPPPPRTPDEAVALLREMARVARLGVVVNDLDRRRLGWIGAWLIGHLLTRNRYTRHDAPLSVRRAYRAGRDGRAAPRGRPDAGPDRSRARSGQRYAIAAVPTPEAPDPGRRPTRRAPANDRRARRGRDRRGRAGRGGRSRRGSRGRARGRRPRAVARVALAGRRRLRVAGRGRRAARGPGSTRPTLAAVARPIPAMRVETGGGTTFRLTYGAEAGGAPAVGFDRSALDPALLDLARAPGADVRRGWRGRGRGPRRPDGSRSATGRPDAPAARLGRRRRGRPAFGRGARGRRRAAGPAARRGSG